VKGDRVTVRILCDEEATEGAIGQGREDSELTAAGQKAVAAGTRAADVVERQMLSALSAKEAKLLRDMLKRCAAALEDQPSC
jgi:hypothetical protein